MLLDSQRRVDLQHYYSSMKHTGMNMSEFRVKACTVALLPQNCISNLVKLATTLANALNTAALL